MDVRILRYFLAVAREESISAAAQYLHLTQPTLSRQLMDLEEELGKQLLVRGGRKVTLTEEGMLLRKRAAEILELVDKTQAEVRDSGASVVGDVYIGAGESDAIRYLARTAAALREQYPDIRYHVSSGDGADVTERLDRGLIDFGLLVGAAPERYDRLRLPTKDRFGVLMPKEHPLAAREAVRPEDLWDEPLILSRQISSSRTLLTWLEREQEQLRIAATYSLLYNASIMVQEGLGLAVGLEKLINTTGDSALCFRPLAPALEVELFVVWKKYQVFSKAAEKFLERLQQDLA